MSRKETATYEGEGDVEVPREHVDMMRRLDAALDASGLFDPPDAVEGGHGNSYPPARLNEIHRVLALCWPHSKVISVYADRWKCAPKLIRRYIERVYEDLRDDDERNRPNRRARLRAAVEQHFELCIRSALEKDDKGRPTAQRPALLSAAGADLDRLAKLDGCYIERVEMTGANGGAVQVDVNFAERLQSLADEEIEVVETLTRKLGGFPLALLTGGKSPSGD